ncbi:nucleolar protein 12 isoform X1 [Selaginella moellendorffii]|uniref:nucleolar protein 12 isoform X1 n=1 Tax=Selaginella moellendorffii TaxID=88036 RepID=UPI000D1CDE6E|nr:nucleolar protein 12 isoform X1 [Selaginella moellendorffii]|eukprot:XP_024543320.1 nucleolar protein 12 isoform X1 [Selaginella moellendorffii]
MFGGGYRKDDGLPAVSTANIFSALERKSSKKKLDKHALQSSQSKQQEDAGQFWVPSPVTVKSWADVEDDDDYFATTAPLPAIWGQTTTKSSQEPSVNHDLNHLEDSEVDEDFDDDADEEVEEEKSEEAGVVSSGQAEQRPQTPTVLRELDKQLSKKEIKKKELAELAAVLAEFGVSTEETKKEAKNEDDEDAVPSNDGDAANNEAERKIAKKKKPKKEKTAPAVPVIMEEIESNVTAVAEPMDVLIKKKLVAGKKKKSVKENSSAATSKVAAEAAARAAKLAAAKKKEKSHYNQQPAR